MTGAVASMSAPTVAPGWLKVTTAAPAADRGRRAATGSVTRPFDEVAVTHAAGRHAETIEVVRVQAQHGVGR